jgi:pimeloyl-ACP methyl ester carboxylesterase
VVLVHGWSGSRRSFDLNVGGLAAGGVRVVAYDQRFHGESDKPSFGLHVARLAADLHQVLETLDLQGVTAVGTSMGCAVLWGYQELYGLQPRVARCVFVDQAPLQNRAPGWTLGSKGCYDAATLAGLREALQGGMKEFAAGNVEACATLPLDEGLLAKLEEDTCKCQPTQLGDLMADHTQLDWRPILPQISVPVLNLAGRQSGIFPPAGTAEVAKRVQDGCTVFFEAANHWLYMEQPNEFNALVLEFARTGARPADGSSVN